MKFDFRLPIIVLVLAICCVIFPFFVYMKLPLFDGLMVTAVEAVQALFLLGVAIFSFLYIQPAKLTEGQKLFWLWSIAWWIMLFGRSTSWGRDYFPHVPRIYFRMVSIAMIAPVVFMLFSPQLRQEIAYKFKHVEIPIWALLLAVFCFIVSDGIEHHRFFSAYILSNTLYQDLMEELYEFPLIIGLFLVAWPTLYKDVHQIKAEIPNSASSNMANSIFDLKS